VNDTRGKKEVNERVLKSLEPIPEEVERTGKALLKGDLNDGLYSF
jgi:hypothetical protein